MYKLTECLAMSEYNIYFQSSVTIIKIWELYFCMTQLGIYIVNEH